MYGCCGSSVSAFEDKVMEVEKNEKKPFWGIAVALLLLLLVAWLVWKAFH